MLCFRVIYIPLIKIESCKCLLESMGTIFFDSSWWFSYSICCSPPFRSEGHSFRLSVIPSFCPTVPQYEPCGRNSSYSFILILLKLYSSLDHALKICMRFGYNPQINFSHIFLQFELSHFSGILTMKVNGQWVPCVRNSSYSFIPINLKFYICLDNALKICMWYGYSPQFNFYYFFAI